MAEETTSTTSDPRLDAIINQYLLGKTAQPAVDPNTGPSSREGRGILSLLGEGLGGGAHYGSTQEREQGGLSALGAAGARMLQASDWSVMPHTFGSILGQGLDAARGNLGHTQAVSAAQHYAAQQLAHEQQQDQIARLKEALPYLQLQEEQRAAARQRELLRPDSSKTSIGAAGGPPDPGSPAGQVATRTAAFWSSQGFTPEQVAGIMAGGPGAESGFNPGAKGDGGTSLGLYQHHADRMAELVKRYGPNPTEAQQHEFAAWEISPKGPLAAVGAQLRTAKTPQEAAAIWTKGFENPKNADDQATARASVAGRYVGYGQAPAKAGAPATTPAAPGQATMPPPEPPLLAGTAQTAGDVGAPTGTVIPPSPPGSEATVAEIEAGRASSPARTGAPQPGAVVTAQAGGQQPATQLPPIKAGDGLITHPGTYSEYRSREFVPPPATEDFNPNLTPAQQRAFASEAAAIEKRAESIAAGRVISPKEVADIRAAREEIKAKVELAAQEKAQKAALAVTKYNETQDNAIRPRYEKEVDAYKAAAQANLAHSQALEIEGEKGKQSRLSTEAGSIVESNKKIRDQLGTDSVASAGRIQNLEGLLALSDNVGDKNTTLQSLATVKYGGKSLLDHLATFGVIPKGDAGPIQMLQSGISGAVTELRAGVQMGALSDRDLNFIESQGPSLLEDQATRTAVIKYLQQAARAKMKFNTIYNEEMTRTEGGRPVSSAVALERARDILEKKYPIVPQMPADLFEHRRDKDPVWMNKVAEWAQENNIKPRTLYRAPGGGLKLVPDPGTPEANNGAFR